MRKNYRSFNACIFVVYTLSTVNIAFSQEYVGWSSSNFSGINQVFLQPAAVADSRHKFDLNLVSVGFNFDNNYLGIRRQGFLGLKSMTQDYADYKDFKDRTLIEYPNGKDKFLTVAADALGPGVMVAIGPNAGIALTSRMRTMFNVDGMDPNLSKLSIEEMIYPELWSTMPNISFDKSRIGMMTWAEYGFTFGHTIYNGGVNYLKGGFSIKVLQGLHSAYMYANKAQAYFINDDTLTVIDASMNYGHSTNFELNSGMLDYKFTGWGVGFDLGLVYEFRPYYEDYVKKYADGDYPRRDKNKYMLKAGFSVTDLGSVRFTKAPKSYDFDGTVFNWDLTQIKIDGVETFDDTLNGRFPIVADRNQTSYKMGLPFAFSFQLDLRPIKGVDFFVNLMNYTSPAQLNKSSKLHMVSRYSITPRFEHYWFGAGIPISYSALGHMDYGFYLHLGPVYFGSADMLRNLFGKSIKGANYYFGVKIYIPQTEKIGVSDLDGDGIPDKADQCVDVAGPKENNGCPYGDKDQDGVLDNADACIDVPGPVENNGCPYGDKDGDGVLDNADKCIDVPGPIENNGCPYGDLDGDGVLDNVDKCIDVPGPKENNGCPYGDKDADGVLDKDDDCIDVPGPAENRGCPYPDTDGDGVLDKDDDCPRTPGPAENRGCPVLKKEEEAIIKRAFDNLEFDSGKDIIRAVSFSSLNELADLLKKNASWGLKLAGHTDNVGDDAKNMMLSNQRASAVKRYLVERGASADKIVVEYYGETRPIADNATPEGRQKNRRVEMTIIFE